MSWTPTLSCFVYKLDERGEARDVFVFLTVGKAFDANLL